MGFSLNFAPLAPYWPVFLTGAWLTLKMTTVAIVVGVSIGTLIAFLKRGSNPYIAKACSAYIEAVRNTPFLVQIFLLYFGLASLGIHMPTFAAAVLAMIINIAAYAAEIIRAGLESVPKGQIEAAECLGLSRWRIAWHVMLQPSIERVYPALTSQFLLMMQASAMASQISAEELTAIANTVQSDTFRSLETYIVVAFMYLALSILVKLLAWGFGEYLFKRRRIIRRAALEASRRRPPPIPPFQPAAAVATAATATATNTTNGSAS
ncbi:MULTISPECIES: amino acid ABC transporter permease [unclassified Herbaspirillum]|uniref:amino acid ABC transporter permease n=1 Tax=unclassified Herbaspirillum TaxID=2624150 RepID=UPI000E2F9D4A|nr:MULTISPECIES: amino acid ABC transporter permease [unclassified Herbaspirillum]RFB73061.1 amino acid ABC transporter permease [Herbaspirillum sp. 3R-3a1]TFI11128.1 amino acid ABC transporter permease [Herbaspirillum sp. 3R11]TFI17036.1 amino acid ABC transporter permease [Herbaspirillum sp. 3R-11]TFI31114.1 amino acid ABC transporter permease [Herbaspirillum sp. 3C11]